MQIIFDIQITKILESYLFKSSTQLKKALRDTYIL